MAKKPFVVLDAEILSSSVWSEAAHVRLVWITLLILCDTEGYVGASIPGIATAAGVPLAEATAALERLQEPDPYSRTKLDDGRRLRPAERGFQILNFREHLDRLSSERTKARDRVWRSRQRAKEKADSNASTTTEQRQSSQGVGSRDQGPVNSTEVRKDTPASRPSTSSPFPAQRAEDNVQSEIRRLQGELGSRIARLSEHPNSRDMVPAWTRRVTAYTKRDGTKINGTPDFRTINSIDRLEKSIADADWWLGKLDKGPLTENPIGSR